MRLGEIKIKRYNTYDVLHKKNAYYVGIVSRIRAEGTDGRTHARQIKRLEETQEALKYRGYRIERGDSLRTHHDVVIFSSRLTTHSQIVVNPLKITTNEGKVEAKAMMSGMSDD